VTSKKSSLGIVVLLAAVFCIPTISVSQSVDRDLGIVRLRYVTIVVRDYDEALKWYTNVLGLEKTEDRTFGKDKRWLVVAPRGEKRYRDHSRNCEALFGVRQGNEPEFRDRGRFDS
jgi:Glyoxalase/Bleomycin resistance protein/Dioxygenase superfamily